MGIKLKTVFTDMYHGIKREFLQLYLDESCYKFNRRYFGERMFERIMIATVYSPLSLTAYTAVHPIVDNH